MAGINACDGGSKAGPLTLRGLMKKGREGKGRVVFVSTRDNTAPVKSHFPNVSSAFVACVL